MVTHFVGVAHCDDASSSRLNSESTSSRSGGCCWCHELNGGGESFPPTHTPSPGFTPEAMTCLNQVILRTPAVGTKGYGNLLLQPRLRQVVDPIADHMPAIPVHRFRKNWKRLLVASGDQAHIERASIQLRPRSMTKNPLQALVGADRDAYFWIKKKLGLGEYQMGALVWFSGLIIGILLGVWFG